MADIGGLGATKRGELRLLEPRTPGTGALYFARQIVALPQWQVAARVANRPGNLYNNREPGAVVAAAWRAAGAQG